MKNNLPKRIKYKGQIYEAVSMHKIREARDELDPLDWEVGDILLLPYGHRNVKMKFVGWDGNIAKFSPASSAAMKFLQEVDRAEDVDGLSDDEKSWDKEANIWYQQPEGLFEAPFTLIKSDGRRVRYDPDTYETFESLNLKEAKRKPRSLTIPWRTINRYERQGLDTDDAINMYLIDTYDADQEYVDWDEDDNGDIHINKIKWMEL